MSFGQPCSHCGACSYENSSAVESTIRCPFCHKYKYRRDGNEVSISSAVDRPCDPPVKSLRGDIEDAINRHSAENGSNTPDYILGQFLVDCLSAFDRATRARTRHICRDNEGAKQ